MIFFSHIIFKFYITWWISEMCLFQNRLRWTPRNEDDRFAFLPSAVFMLSAALWCWRQVRTGFYFSIELHWRWNSDVWNDRIPCIFFCSLVLHCLNLNFLKCDLILNLPQFCLSARPCDRNTHSSLSIVFFFFVDLSLHGLFLWKWLNRLF